jgi:hypothetical protein
MLIAVQESPCKNLFAVQLNNNNKNLSHKRKYRTSCSAFSLRLPVSVVSRENLVAVNVTEECSTSVDGLSVRGVGTL